MRFKELFLETNNKDREYNGAADYYSNLKKERTPDELKRIKKFKKITSPKFNFNGTREGNNTLSFFNFDKNNKDIDFVGSKAGDQYNWNFNFKTKKATSEYGARGNGETLDFKDIDADVIKQVVEMYNELIKLGDIK